MVSGTTSVIQIFIKVYKQVPPLPKKGHNLSLKKILFPYAFKANNSLKCIQLETL